MITAYPHRVLIRASESDVIFDGSGRMFDQFTYESCGGANPFIRYTSDNLFVNVETRGDVYSSKRLFDIAMKTIERPNSQKGVPPLLYQIDVYTHGVWHTLFGAFVAAVSYPYNEGAGLYTTTVSLQCCTKPHYMAEKYGHLVTT